jgi:hypothetical protein
MGLLFSLVMRWRLTVDLTVCSWELTCVGWGCFTHGRLVGVPWSPNGGTLGYQRRVGVGF